MAFHSPKPKLTPKEMMLWQLKNVIEDINNGGYLLQVKLDFDELLLKAYLLL